MSKTLDELIDEFEFAAAFPDRHEYNRWRRALTAYVEGLERDARRYRWLVDRTTLGHWIWKDLMMNFPEHSGDAEKFRETLESLIDAEMHK